MKKIMFIVACLVIITSLAGCDNTWRGAGEDVEKAGNVMQGK